MYILFTVCIVKIFEKETYFTYRVIEELSKINYINKKCDRPCKMNMRIFVHTQILIIFFSNGAETYCKPDSKAVIC